MELTGIHRKSLSGYENNVAEPDLQTFSTLVKLYGVSADSILEINPNSKSNTLSKRELQLINLFRSLDEQHQKELIIQLHALTKFLKSD